MGLAEDFTAATEYVRNLPSDGPVKPSNDVKLKFYALFKQATLGRCTGDKPGILSLEARKKWESWDKLGNMSKEDAMSGYITELNKLKSAAGQ